MHSRRSPLGFRQRQGIAGAVWAGASEAAGSIGQVTVSGQLDLLVAARPVAGEPVMSDRLRALLVRRGRPLEVGQIVAQVLRLRGCPLSLQRRLVAEIVESDARLAWLGRDLVGLAPPRWASEHVADATFCIVDLETTGGSPGSSKITEIGAVRVSGLAIVDRFSLLVDPERPIPEGITRLTGINNEMVAGQPEIGAALEQFVAFARDDVLVAHNAPFDLRFLTYERRRTAARYFTQPWLDTLTLARRLLAGRVERHDLATLADWADTDVRPAHRALPDAEATAELLIRFLGMLADQDIDTVERVVAIGAPGGTRHSWKLALADDLPAAPGIYLMRNRRGDVLYVGKARDLRRRVRSYFGPGGRHGRLIGRALEQLERIDYECCASELDALLAEHRVLRDLRPPCNQRGLESPTWRIVLTGEDVPRLRVLRGFPVAQDGTMLCVSTERRARMIRDVLFALYPLNSSRPLPHPEWGDGDGWDSGSPARADPDDNGVRAGELRALVGPNPAAALGRLAVRFAEAVRDGRMAIDDAGQQQFQALLRELRVAWRAHVVRQRTALFVEPAATAGQAVVFGIAFGEVVGRSEVDLDNWPMSVDRILRALMVARAAPLSSPLDSEALIIDARMRERGQDGTVDLGGNVSIDRALVGVAPLIAQACARGRTARVLTPELTLLDV
jgi:DNA polymerase III epsilon subunit family exonuclease